MTPEQRIVGSDISYWCSAEDLKGEPGVGVTYR
jgi:hypothetical protein